MSEGTRVVITGAASGIGAAAAAALRARGARVVGLDIDPRGEDILRCDVREQGSVDRAVANAIERLGGLDVLINNAGIGTTQSAGAPPGPDAHATAYCMSKRGLVSYSDALRFEHGDAITVTTVYPGYIRTPIHTASQEEGFALEGLVPAEPLGAAAHTLARAALGRPRRDLATTRSGTLLYLVARIAPRSAIDLTINRALRTRASQGYFDRSLLARGFVEQLRRA